MLTTRARPFRLTGILFIMTALTGTLLYGGCDSGDLTGPSDHQVEEIVISPGEATLEVGEQMQFSAVARTAAGDTVDTSNLNIEWEWWSTNPDVFSVEAGGLAIGHDPGEAFCVVEATILVGTANFNGRDSALVVVF